MSARLNGHFLRKSVVWMSIAVGSTAFAQNNLQDNNLSAFLGEASASSNISSEPPRPLERAIKNLEKDSVSVVLSDDDSVSGELTRSDIELIEKKRAVLIRYLYEQEKLSDVRRVMDERNRTSEIEKSITNEFPLSPAEITELRRLQLKISQASNSPATGPVETKIRTVDIDIESTTPISLDVSKGFASSLVFYDETGKPWPIEGDIIGDQSAFTSRIVGANKHIAVFEISREFAESNALINLTALPVPLVVRLVGREGVVDSRLSVRLPKMGPNAETGFAEMSNGVENAPEEVLQMLNGGRLPSGKGVEYELVGASGTVYYFDGSLYIRTKSDLMSPPINPPLSMELQSPTGFNVYKIPPVTQLLFSDQGKLVTATIKPKSLIDTSPRTDSIFEMRGSPNGR